MSTKEYRDCYVAFLDILGFKNMINYKKCDELYGIFESIKESSYMGVKLNDVEMKTFRDIEYTIMSDSVVVYVDATLDDALFALLCTCQTIQMELLDKGILIRGGIARGSLFRENYVIFGQGLSNAYLLESNIASVPRIIFNQQLLDDGKEHNVGLPQGAWHYMLITQDDDELYYINPVALPRVVSYVDGRESVSDYYDKVLIACQNKLDTTYDPSIRQKYLWLKSKTMKQLSVNREIMIKQYAGDHLLKKWNI